MQIFSKKYLSVILLAGCLFSNIAVASEATDKEQNEIPNYKEVNVDIKKDGPVLLFSDSPEMVTNCGVMYRDTVAGDVRLFFHHVNDTKTAKRLAVVLHNRGIRPVEVTVGNKGVSKPSRGWLNAGKMAQSSYFKADKADKETKITIKPGGSQEFLTGEKGQIFEPQELITGIIDFHFSRPLEVSVMMIPVGTAFSAAVSEYEVLPPDKGEYVLRGTFKNADRHITFLDVFNNDKDEVLGITLADNKKDLYARGLDATTGKVVVNYGNYGVVYNLYYKTRGEGDAILRFNPWGGTFAGTCLLENEDIITEISVPMNRIYFGDKRPNENMILKKIAGKTEGKVVFSPPGSSNLPVRIFLAAD